MKSLATLSGNNHNITLEKNNILLNNEHFRTVLGCCNAERLSLASRTGADDKLNLLPQDFFFQPLNMILPLFSFFSLYIGKKKNQIFLSSQLQKQIDLETICIMLTCTMLQDRSLPPHMHAHKSTHAQLLSIIKFHFFFLKTVFFPIISSDFSSWAMFSLCCKWESEQHCPAVYRRAKPWGGSLQKLAPF